MVAERRLIAVVTVEALMTDISGENKKYRMGDEIVIPESSAGKLGRSLKLKVVEVPATSTLVEAPDVSGEADNGEGEESPADSDKPMDLTPAQKAAATRAANAAAKAEVESTLKEEGAA